VTNCRAQTARTVERVELLSTAGRGELLRRANCFCDLFKRSGELASRLVGVRLRSDGSASGACFC
jgi:hypothetical protein